MREYGVAATFDLPATATLLDAVHHNAEQAPDHVSFSRQVAGQWEPVTARDFAAEMTRLASGFAAAGIAPGDRVGLLSKTRYEWTLCDYALWAVGAVVVPIYDSSSAEQLAYILRDSGAVALVLETDEHGVTLEQVRGELPVQIGRAHV